MTSDERAAGIQAMREEFASARKRLGDARFTARSDDEWITITVNSAGNMVGLELDPRLFRRPDAEGLGESIMQAYERARAEAAAGTAEVLRGSLGPGVDIESLQAGENPEALIKATGRHLMEKFRLGRAGQGGPADA